jgi:hypothetical protein
MSTPEELPTTTPFKIGTNDGDADVWIITDDNLWSLTVAAEDGDVDAASALSCCDKDENACSSCKAGFTDANEPYVHIVVHFLEAVDEDGEDLVKVNELCEKCSEGDTQEIVRRELEKMGVLRERTMQ